MIFLRALPTALLTRSPRWWPRRCFPCSLASICAASTYRLNAKKPPALRPQREGDPVVLGVMLGLYCGLYLLFLVISCRALPEMLRPGGAPELYSGYARQGFFQLCAAAVLNLAVFLGVRRQRCAGRGFTRGAQTLLAALTLCLIALALTKMLLYIRLYGLTLLRLYTSCMMVALAVLFLRCWFPCTGPCPMLRLGAALAACTLAVVGLNERPGAWVARPMWTVTWPGFAGNGPDPVYGLPGRGGSGPVPPAGADRGPRTAGGSPDPV